MREGPVTAIRREDYVAPAYWIRSVELCFDLDPAKTIVSSRMAIERNAGEASDVGDAAPPAPSLVLHGDALSAPLRVLIDGQSVSFRHDERSLVIEQPPAAERFTLEIRNAICPEKNTQLSGLYTSGGGFFTQCEAEGFRRITYFLDRPDVMAVYTVTLRADRARFPVLLSNGNLVEQGDLENGRHFAKWHDPFPKPSYLFALVGADLVCREQRVRSRGGKDHLLQIYVRRGDLGKTEHAMDSLVASVVWDEARFGLALDLDRFMIVAVGDFNMGAMENKGLNIFNTKYVLASPATATDRDFAAIESVVGHEYFHNWTGNRITCRDWFQLSLKEGLTVFRDQEFSMDMAGDARMKLAPTPSTRAVKRIADVRMLRASQFPEDAGPMSHPVRPDRYVAIDNFYTATVYEKGAEVVRMMATLVGREGFRRGMALYFERHDGQAVTCDDFAQAIADANPHGALATRLDLFKRWYSQAGTPTLEARGEYDAAARRYLLTLSQKAPATGPAGASREPWTIPVRLGLVGRDGARLPLRLAEETEAAGDERLLVLDGLSSRFEFVDVDQAPVPSLLRGFSAPVHLDDCLDPADLLVLLAHDADPFNRWEAGQRLMLRSMQAALDGGQLPTLDDALAQALRGVLRDPALDAAYKELVLTLPDEIVIAECQSAVDPQRIHAVHESLRGQLAGVLNADWEWAWETNRVVEGYAPTPQQAGRRALANLALSMLVLHAVRTGDAVWPGKAYGLFKGAGNMTDRIGALNALVRAHADLAAPALERFHAMFADDPLVIDKWFDLQARAPEKEGRVFARARALMKHRDFSLANPNRARSLLVGLMAGNPAAFHRPDAAGYLFWAERMLELDPINPQMAARLARVMDRWSRLAEPYRSAAREAIGRVAAKPDLSDDLREIVSRAIAE